MFEDQEKKRNFRRKFSAIGAFLCKELINNPSGLGAPEAEKEEQEPERTKSPPSGSVQVDFWFDSHKAGQQAPSYPLT